MDARDVQDSDCTPADTGCVRRGGRDGCLPQQELSCTRIRTLGALGWSAVASYQCDAAGYLRVPCRWVGGRQSGE